jgi:hypothetical protein
MPTATIGKNYSLPGVESLQVAISRVGESVVAFGGSDAPITLEVAKQMTDYAEGDPNVVTGNLAADHGQTDGNFDFFWKESGVEKCRYSVPVTFATNALTTTNDGAGDAFPTTPDAQPILCKQKTVSPALIDADALSVFWAAVLFGNPSATGRGHVAGEETAGTAVGGFNVTGIQQGTAVAEYDITGGAANPLTGNVIGKLQVTHNDLVYTPTFVFRGVLTDVTP